MAVSNSNHKAAQDPTSLTHELLAAVDEGSISEVQKLLKTAGITINGTNKHGESALHIAAGYGRSNIVKLLCKSGAHVDCQDKQGDTPLYWAARHGHLDVVIYLSESRASINTRDQSGETALHVSAKYGHPEVLSFLCHAGATMDTQDNHGDTALLCGCWHGYQNVVECLVAAGCSLQARNKDRETALHVAAVRGYHGILRFLCERGASLDAKDKSGCTALHLATRRNHLDIVQYLCERNCSTSMQDSNGDTPLHDACRNGQLATFHALNAAKCDLNLPNKNGATPLHLAAKYGHTELVRQLCVAGCDLDTVTEHGFTADEVAANCSHDELATLIHHLRQENLRDFYVSELVQNQEAMSRAKLLVCGAAGVGKTELTDSLKCRFIRSLFRKRSSSTLAMMLLKRTHGMIVQQVAIPNAGDFSVWDFSGLKEYYVTHEHFLGQRNSIVLVVFSLRDPLQKQIAQVRFWLAMIKSKQAPPSTIHFAGDTPHKPYLVLVGSFADQPPSWNMAAHNSVDVFAVPLASSEEPAPSCGEAVLSAMREEFGDHFVFPGEVYQLDCRLSQSREIRSLRQHLATLRTATLQKLPKVPPLVQTLSQLLPSWRREHLELPVLTWSGFLLKTRERVNPLVSEEKMKGITAALHDMGEVICIAEGPLYNIVILDPSWLGVRILGPALSPENSVIPQLKSVTGRVTLSTIQRVYPEWDSTSIAHLFEHFQLCSPQDEARTVYEFPCLIKMEPLFGLWEKDASFAAYVGVSVKCCSKSDIFSPGLFPQIQVKSRKAFADDIDDQELTLWTNGLKCCRGDVEILLKLREPDKVIEIIARTTDEARLECYRLLQEFYSLVQDAIRSINPGTNAATFILSPRQLKEHREPAEYSAMEIFEAEREDRPLRHLKYPDVEESILDLVCCGCSELLVTVKSAPYAILSDVPVQTRVQLCRMLDPPDVYGRNWCLLALQLGLSEEVPAIDQADDSCSPTDKLLAVWDKGSSSTVVTLVDALRAIGRDDAAKALIEGLSLFKNASNSVVINVPGVALTSYVC